MNQTTDTDEQLLRQPLLSAEQSLNDNVIQQLANARAKAIAQENNWFKEYYERLANGYRGMFSASLATAAIVAMVVLPLQEEGVSINESLYAEDSVTILMEDPEFYLWLDKSGMLVAER